jgi:hypothetical protein
VTFLEQATGGPGGDHKARVEVKSEKNVSLSCILFWTHDRQQNSGQPGRWRLALYFPGQDENTAEHLQALEGCTVEVLLCDEQQETCALIHTSLQRVPNRSGLGCDPEPVELADPHVVKEIQLIPGPPRKRYNLS